MTTSLSELLAQARAEATHGIKKSKQSAYHRRAPHEASVPHLTAAKTLLHQALEYEPGNAEALLLMSQVSESLMDFVEAEEWLSKALGAGVPKSKKTLKRKALLRESATFWNELLLDPYEVRDLGVYLESVGVDVTSTTLDKTRAWLSQNVDNAPELVIEALGRQGAYSDFQVLGNIVNP